MTEQTEKAFVAAGDGREVPRVGTELGLSDWLGAAKVRSGFGRMKYTVEPGLYAVGKPDADSVVLVSANYKLSFDIVRRSLKGLNAWILVLETYGINVWCAAGKGTFGTDEIVRQIKDSQLKLYVSHKRIIVPQLGAPGVSGFKIKEATGFSVKFGPVRAEDLKEYISAGYKKSPAMRTVQFNFVDRLILTPVEIVNSLRYLLYAIIVITLISGINAQGYAFTEMWQEGLTSGLFLLLAYISGAFIGPALLPWLPFRYFSGKGLVAGFLVYGLASFLSGTADSVLYLIGWLLISGAISSFLTMNFTGASTYTSLSGVRKEMRLFVPLQIVLLLAGLTLFIISQLK